MLIDDARHIHHRANNRRTQLKLKIHDTYTYYLVLYRTFVATTAAVNSSAAAATDRHGQPAPLLFLAEASSSNNSAASSIDICALISITDCSLLCVPQLFASSTLGTQLEKVMDGTWTAATSNRRAAAAAAAAVLD